MWAIFCVHLELSAFFNVFAEWHCVDIQQQFDWFSLPDLESLHNCDLKQYRFVVCFFHPDRAAAYNHKSSCIFQSVVKTNGDIVFWSIACYVGNGISLTSSIVPFEAMERLFSPVHVENVVVMIFISGDQSELAGCWHYLLLTLCGLGVKLRDCYYHGCDETQNSAHPLNPGFATCLAF